jgi:hypothetical protein
MRPDFHDPNDFFYTILDLSSWGTADSELQEDKIVRHHHVLSYNQKPHTSGR